VFRIKGDGSLEPSPGSPFPSGGTAPGALGLSGNILVVANKAQDGVRDLKSVEANYTTFHVGADGALTRTGFTQTVPPKSSPTQVFVAPGGDQVFTTEETGVLRGYQLGSDGKLTAAPANPVKLGPEVFDRGHPPKVIWPAGLSADLDEPVLYTGIPNYSSIAAYDYEDNGTLKFASTVHDTKSFLPCWSIVNAESDRLYFANAGSGNISVYDIGEDPRHPKLMQTVELPGGGNPWNLQLDPTGDYLYIMTPRQVKEIPRGDGQLLHSLRVQSDGTLTEVPDSPVPMPVAVDSNPLGLAVVARR
jgi:6-phosphogluconolactonase (cycloisomerase 2 family)